MGSRCVQSSFAPNEYITYLGSCYGEPQLVSSTTHEGDKFVVNEYVIDRLVPVPKLQTTETVVEKTIVIPQVRVIEELVDVPYKVREKIVEISKPIIHETIIEKPEREIRETTLHLDIERGAAAEAQKQNMQPRHQPPDIIYHMPQRPLNHCKCSSTESGGGFERDPNLRRTAALPHEPEYRCYTTPSVESSWAAAPSPAPPPRPYAQMPAPPPIAAAPPKPFASMAAPPPMAAAPPRPYAPMAAAPRARAVQSIPQGEKQKPRIMFSPECPQASAPAAEGPDRQFRKLQTTPTASAQQVEYIVPKIKTVYKKHYIPIRVPRFIETAVAAEQCDEALLDAAANCDQGMLDTLASLGETDSTQTPGSAPTLGELDQCWNRISNLNFDFEILQQTAAENIRHWWDTNQLLIDSASIASVCAGVDASGEGFIETVSVVRKRSMPPTLRDPSSSSDEGDLDDAESLASFSEEQQQYCAV